MAFLLLGKGLRAAAVARTVAAFLVLVLAALAVNVLPGAAQTGPRDGTWKQLPPPAFHRLDDWVTFDPRGGRLLSLEWRETGMTLWSFDVAGAGGWTAHPILNDLDGYRFHALVVDTVANRLLALVSEYGYENDPPEYELKALDLVTLTAWTPVPIGGPQRPARSGSAAVFDGARNRLIVLGGDDYSINELSGEIWQLSLGAVPQWSEIVPVGPALPGRYYATAFMDEELERLVIAGGEDSVQVDDIYLCHAIDLGGDRTWRALGVADSLRYYSSQPATYDPASRSLVMVRGWFTSDASPDSSRMLVLSTEGAGQWTRVLFGGSVRVVGTSDHRLFADPVRNRILFAGGRGATDQPDGYPPHSDVWVVDLAGPRLWTRLYGSISADRYRPTGPVVFDPVGQRTITLGGDYFSAISAFTIEGVTRWTGIPTTGPGPARRSGAVAAYDPGSSRAVMFGGGMNNVEVGDLWELSFAFSPARWRRVIPMGIAPGPRLGAAAVYDPLRRRLVMFGGYAGITLDETWGLDLTEADPAWKRIETRGVAPSPRFWHAAVYDSRRDGMVIHGGATGDPRDPVSALGDTWFLSFADCDAWIQLAGEQAIAGRRYLHGAAYDPVGDRVIVMWGRNIPGDRDDMSMLSLGAEPRWDSFWPEGFRANDRYQPFLHYDEPRDRLVLVGGGYDFISSDTWAIEWNRNTTPPPFTGGPGDVRILGVGPNPSRGDVNIAFDLPRPATVETRLYDVRGRLVRNLGRATYTPGPHILCWDGRADSGERLRDGVYFARLVVEGNVFSGKIVLMD